MTPPVLHQQHPCFGKELGFGLDPAGRLPNNTLLYTVVFAITILVLVGLAVVGALIFV